MDRKLFSLYSCVHGNHFLTVFLSCTYLSTIDMRMAYLSIKEFVLFVALRSCKPWQPFAPHPWYGWTALEEPGGFVMFITMLQDLLNIEQLC